MKWCCNRYTTGISFGAIYIVGSIFFFIISCFSYDKYEHFVSNPERKEILQSQAIHEMIACAVSALISSLFIVAIVKRLRYLILPWLVLVVFIFFVVCQSMYWWFIGAGIGGASGATFLILLLITVLAVVFQVFIFYFSILLFKKIRQENIEISERVKNQMTEKTLI